MLKYSESFPYFSKVFWWNTIIKVVLQCYSCYSCKILLIYWDVADWNILAEAGMCYVLLLLLSRTILAAGNKVPVIMEHPLDMTVARNEPVTLNCKVRIFIVMKPSVSMRADTLSGGLWGAKSGPDHHQHRPVWESQTIQHTLSSSSPASVEIPITRLFLYSSAWLHYNLW